VIILHLKQTKSPNLHLKLKRGLVCVLGVSVCKFGVLVYDDLGIDSRWGRWMQVLESL